MRRHLDDHPGLSNSGIFGGSSNSSRPTSPNSTSRDPGGIPNIPVTTARASDTHKPPSSRQPLALIQETVHAVGGSGSSEMQSGIQFSLPSGYQARVAAATTLSQGSLGHSQPPSTVHHSLSIQAHSNTQIVHPMQQANSQGHQMQFQRLKVEDALSYLDQVKYKFGNQPQVYNDFLDIMKEFKSQSIDTPGVIQRVSNLFRGHPELIVGFNTFLPPGYRIEVQSNEQVQVSIPGTVSGGQGPTSLTIHPTGPPSATVHPMPQANHAGRDASPHASPAAKPPPVTNSQPHTNSQNQHPLHQNSPPQTQPSTVPAAATTGPSNAPPPASQPVEFNHAINYVNKIKNLYIS